MKFNFRARSAHCSGPGRKSLGLLPLDGPVVSPLRADGAAPQHASSMFSSAGQYPIDFANMVLTRGYSGTRAYCQSE